MPEFIACHIVSGEDDYLLEVAVPNLEDYRKFLIGPLLELALVKGVRSDIAIETLKSAAPLPFGPSRNSLIGFNAHRRVAAERIYHPAYQCGEILAEAAESATHAFGQPKPLAPDRESPRHRRSRQSE